MLICEDCRRRKGILKLLYSITKLFPDEAKRELFLLPSLLLRKMRDHMCVLTAQLKMPPRENN